jgi:hypothetical protein
MHEQSFLDGWPRSKPSTKLACPIHHVIVLCDEWAFALHANRTPYRDRNSASIRSRSIWFARV